MQNHVNKEAQLALESLLAGLNRDQLQSLCGCAIRPC